MKKKIFEGSVKKCKNKISKKLTENDVDSKHFSKSKGISKESE